MQFVNHTSFHAQDFAGIDQHGQEFFIIALRQTLEWGDDAVLNYCAKQESLCESDVSWGDPHLTSVRQESDYCHFKPKCDVIVNATAYAPKGIAARSYPVRLQVRLADTTPALPEPPQGMGKFMSPPPGTMRHWRESLPAAPTTGEILVNKQLLVLGKRQFERGSAFVRSALGLLRIATLGVVNLGSWTLSRPTPALSVPLRAEFGFGGECRVVANTLAGDRVAVKHKLTEGQQAAHAPADAHLERSTIAYAAFALNPLGRGYAQPWFITATKARIIAAPQIELPAAAISVHDFNACLKGRQSEDLARRTPTGYGVRPKSHPDRLRLAGTIDSEFAQSDRWLPDDFDFAVWNAAQPDQQTPFLNGGEVIELINMCPDGAPGTTHDRPGNTMLTLRLPTSECYVLLRLESGEMFTHAMVIDTVIVEPDERRLSLVWRTIIAKADDVPLRAVEAMTRTHAERDLDKQEVESFKTAMASADQPAGGQHNE
jgi:hypothetical protein